MALFWSNHRNELFRFARQLNRLRWTWKIVCYSKLWFAAPLTLLVGNIVYFPLKINRFPAFLKKSFIFGPKHKHATNSFCFIGRILLLKPFLSLFFLCLHSHDLSHEQFTNDEWPVRAQVNTQVKWIIKFTIYLWIDLKNCSILFIFGWATPVQCREFVFYSILSCQANEAIWNK